MPSKSKSQHRLMEAAAHTRGGYGGVPQKVGKDFVKVDKEEGKFPPRHKDLKPKPPATPRGYGR